MLEKSFKFIEGFNREIQRKLHQEGINSWNDFIGCGNIDGIPDDFKKRVDEKLKEMKGALENKEYRYFAKNLPPSSHWRLYDVLKAERRLCYLDIETTGLQFFNDEITVVGIYDGTYHQVLTAGVDLNRENLEAILAPYDMLVSYYGLKFDVPFLKYKFPDLDLNHLHFDMSFVGRKLELGRSLKEMEKNFDIVRCDDLATINGYHAVKLWESYQEGNAESLELLIEHNHCDTENLEKLADKLYYYLVDIDY